MKKFVLGGLFAASASLGAATSDAASFTGYVDEPGTVYFNGGAFLSFDTVSGGSLFDDGLGLVQVTGAVAGDFSSPSLNVFDLSSFSTTFDSDSMVDYMLGFNIDAAGSDMISVLWDLTGPAAVGSTDYGIMTFTGELGADNETDFLPLLGSTGVFALGNLTVIGASPEVIPLPASAFLLLAGLGALAVGRARRRK